MLKHDARDDDKNKVLILPSSIPYHYGGKASHLRLTQLQFPLKIAFALTITQSPGTISQKRWHFAP